MPKICPECKGRGYIDLMTKRVPCEACKPPHFNVTLSGVTEEIESLSGIHTSIGFATVLPNPPPWVVACYWVDSSARRKDGVIERIRIGHITVTDDCKATFDEIVSLVTHMPAVGFKRDIVEFQHGRSSRRCEFKFVDSEMVWRMPIQ